MKDIARDLGVSVATVSRALKDSSRISTAQKERIQKYAREHNFFPNFLGEALRHNKVKPMKVIGVIVPQVVHYYFMSVLSGIEEEARARGYRVMVAQSNERYDKEVAICEDFYQNKVCGIIVSQAKDTKQYDHFEKLLQNGVPLIFYDRICTGVNSSRVVVDDYMGAFTAVTHMIDTGCRNSSDRADQAHKRRYGRRNRKYENSPGSLSTFLSTASSISIPILYARSPYILY